MQASILYGKNIILGTAPGYWTCRLDNITVWQELHLESILHDATDCNECKMHVNAAVNPQPKDDYRQDKYIPKEFKLLLLLLCLIFLFFSTPKK